LSAEIIRAGIISVDAGQSEAAAALGIPKRRQFFKIVLPQAVRAINAERRERGDQPVQGHVHRLHDGHRRTVLPGAGDLWRTKKDNGLVKAFADAINHTMHRAEAGRLHADDAVAAMQRRTCAEGAEVWHNSPVTGLRTT
jgi:hypothetical protein